MSSIIRATTTSGLQIAPDNSGSLILQTNGTTTALTIDTSQNATFAGTLTATGKVTSSSMPTGSVIQVVIATTNTFASTTNTIPLDDTIPQNTEGAEFLTCSITPKFSTSKLYIDVVFNTVCNTSSALSTIALFQDSTASALIACWGVSSVGNGPPPPMVMSYSMTSGTTSSTTFKVRGGQNSAGTFQVNGSSGARYLGGAMISFIKITEVAS
jgi:hypothetical protein